jgi:glutathione S-transferase
MLRVFTFSPAYGLPTYGPFGLKLEACLRMLDVPYERVAENDTRKGPKRKSPWIEDGAVRLGDTELILDHVARTYGKELDRELTDHQRAQSLVLQRMLEEHFHQIYEYELCLTEPGWASLKTIFASGIPRILLPVIAPRIRAAFRAHLFERGIARHTPAEVEAMGRADIDAIANWLGSQSWFLGGEHPTKVDASAFGLLAPTIRSQLPTPVYSYARTKTNLVAFVDRAVNRFFAEKTPAG